MQYATIAISFVSLLLASYSFLSKNAKDTTAELTTLIVKLETISSGINDIKAELTGLKNDQRDDHDKLIRVESSLKAAWKQINKVTGNPKSEDEEDI